MSGPARRDPAAVRSAGGTEPAPSASVRDEAVLRVENLGFTYVGAGAPALSEVSFSLERGEVLGVLGPVGAGKTTLCLCVAGLMPRVFGGRLTGELEVAGIDPRRAPPIEVSSHLGIVFEDYSAQLTQVRALDEVAAPLENRGVSHAEARDRARELLARLGLEREVEAKRTWELSGGQQQRIAIAASLALDPGILLLDNITTMLDPQGKRQARDMVAELAEEKTLVVVDDDVDFLQGVADRVLLLAGGRTVVAGPAHEVLRDHTTLYDAGVVPPGPLVAARMIRLAVQPLTLEEFREAAGSRCGEGGAGGAASSARGAQARKPSNGAGGPGNGNVGRAGIDNGGNPDSPERGSKPPGEVVLDARGVSYRYPDGTHALHGVDLEVRRGEVHGLLGGNGAGKSTLAEIVAGLKKPHGGSVIVAGRDATAFRAMDLASTVGMAFQKPDLQLTEQTVRLELAFPLERRRHERAGFLRRRERYDDEEVAERVQHAAKLAGLHADLLGLDPSTLPFAQRKLVALASAAVLDPDLILLDEPGTGLDAAAHGNLARFVRSLRELGKAVVLVEHEIGLVAELTDSVTVLDRGRVALSGPTRTVFAPGNWARLEEFEIAPPFAARLAHAVGVEALTYGELATACGEAG